MKGSEIQEIRAEVLVRRQGEGMGGEGRGEWGSEGEGREVAKGKGLRREGIEGGKRMRGKNVESTEMKRGSEETRSGKMGEERKGREGKSEKEWGKKWEGEMRKREDRVEARRRG